MKNSLMIASLTILIAAMPAYGSESITTSFVNAQGEKIGTANLREMNNGTLITVDIHLPEGVHALHIHENGQCDAPDFKTAGGHFNPEGHKHGYDSKEGFHAGDLPNLFVKSTGHIKTEIFSTRLHIEGPNGLGHGTSFVIHEKADDYTSDPSGNAGSRIACAVIKQ